MSRPESYPRPGWTPPIPAPPARPPLVRATSSSPDMPTPWMGGVCSGLAVHLGIPVLLVRVTLIGFTVLGVGAVAYLWLWVTVPEDTPEASASGTLSPGLVRLREERAAQVARNRMIATGVGLLVAAVAGTILNATSTLDWRDMGSIISIVSGITLVWSQSREVRNWRSVRFIGAVLGGIALLSLGVVMVASRDNPPVILLRGGLIGAALVAGVLFALVPMWLRTTKDLSQAQAQRVRDAERADIAAHLHDSVLQALTLIRASAEDPARVRAIALTEERELRAWLYTGHAQAADSLDAAVTEAVVGVESRYGVPISVVVVGDMRPGPGELALVAALAEACQNAVRHGAPPVSVYVEVRPQAVEAFIKDSGEGFDPASIAADRHGVRDSIVGRMRRTGGNATIRRLARGTEVALSVPRSDILEETAPNGRTQ
ncbi:ATP-binding protein [Sanguibacter keddieii]|uniref:ATP-binding protein n=1 Tax=Sanguibacter keddieii TaxID=60920 RepID=UPI0019554518|nr:ATP-binding protein [Sanguibacter keddieii]